jgi:hypothetical protein
VTAPARFDQHNLPGPAFRLVAWVRDEKGDPRPLVRDSRTGKLSDGRRHVRSLFDERRAPGGARQPRHLFLRDVRGSSEARMAMERVCPRAAAILDDYEQGRLESYEAICDADERFVAELDTWRRGYIRGRRRDADSLFLQLETVFSMNKVIEVTYAMPSIEEAFPVTVINTRFDSARSFVRELAEENAQVGGDVKVSFGPTASTHRGERFHRLVPVFASANITEEEVRRYQEAQQANPNSGLDFDLWEERLRGASLAVQREVGRVEAFGRPQNGILGLFRSSGAYEVPSEALVFAGATSTTNYDNVALLLRNQFTAVAGREDRQADSLALSPESFLLLSQQVYNSANASNVTTIEMIMRGNPQIESIYRVRECKPRTEEATRLEAVGYDATEAAINSGGLRVSGTQRNALVAFRRDPKMVEIIHGYSLETTVYPPVLDRTTALVRQSTGGMTVYEPQTMRIAYEA